MPTRWRSNGGVADHWAGQVRVDVEGVLKVAEGVSQGVDPLAHRFLRCGNVVKVAHAFKNASRRSFGLVA